MSARTARRRRIQAKNGYRHLAKIGRGNNNRPIFHVASLDKQQQREAAFRERRAAMQSRKAFKKG